MTSKRKNREELFTPKLIGRILKVSAFAIILVNFVLMTMKDKDLGTIWLLLWTSACMFFAGMILSHLPQERLEGKKENEK